MNEGLSKLFEGEDLTQEFKDAVHGVFENAVDERAQEKEQEIKDYFTQVSEDYASYVVKEAEDNVDVYIKEELVPMVEKYMDYSVSEFVSENKMAIESGTKLELAENFLSGLSGITESYNVQVPEGKEDYISEMEQKVNSMQEKFDRALSQVNSLKEEINEKDMDSIIESKSVNLTESQKEKFTKVAKRVNFQDSDQYSSAINELFDSYFPVKENKDDETTKFIKEEYEHDTDSPKTWASELMSRI